MPDRSVFQVVLRWGRDKEEHVGLFESESEARQAANEAAADAGRGVNIHVLRCPFGKALRQTVSIQGGHA